MTLAEQQTWIKLNRNITRWRWYRNGNTTRVFLHLLLKANVKENSFMSIKLHRGEAATSPNCIAKDLGITTQQVRTALAHLQETGEISVTGYPQCSVYRIEKYDQYQQNSHEAKPERKRTRKSKDKDIPAQSSEPEEKSEYVPKYWELQIPKHYHGMFDSEEQYYSYAEEHPDEVAVWVMS